MFSNSFGVLFWTDIMAIFFVTAQILFVLAVSSFVISAIDDVLFDLYFWSKKWFSCFRKCVKVDESLSEELFDKLEQYMAIMLPAWQEAGILRPSAAKILSTLKYTNYHVFIGTYPNDLDTQRKADILAGRFSQVHKVVTPLPDPTCKADYLNKLDHRHLSSGLGFFGVEWIVEG